MAILIRPPYDPELATVLRRLLILYTLTFDDVSVLQTKQDAIWNAESVLAGQPFSHEEISIPGPNGNPVCLSIFRPVGNHNIRGESTYLRPCIFWIHGGGMLLTNRFIGVDIPLAWARTCQAIVISIEYRVAPTHPAPAAVEDCYTAISWACKIDNAEEIGIDREKVLVAGASAGGGLAAGVGFMARDRILMGGPSICGLVLTSPMLDDRVSEEIGKQFRSSDDVVWSTESNEFAWKAALGDLYDDDTVSPYIVPARAKNLANMPPTYIDVGSVDVLRDGCVQFAEKLWKAGGQADLHVWAGGFHLFDILASNAALSQKSIAMRASWVQRVLG
ncbi:alpha/beta hydrolase domain protein [Xylariomycetidae sp. FL2044]|nr:alpha/beta hydrolase domain protein [Xylariomycetidae sp. FL2044]